MLHTEVVLLVPPANLYYNCTDLILLSDENLPVVDYSNHCFWFCTDSCPRNCNTDAAADDNDTTISLILPTIVIYKAPKSFTYLNHTSSSTFSEQFTGFCTESWSRPFYSSEFKVVTHANWIYHVLPSICHSCTDIDIPFRMFIPYNSVVCVFTESLIMKAILLGETFQVTGQV